MIGYDELVDALASWRSRQGLAETGADYLGPARAFPEYRVAQASQDHAHDDGAEVAYDVAAEVDEADIAAEAAYDADAFEELAHDDDAEPGSDALVAEAVAYDDNTDANVDVATLAAERDRVEAAEMMAEEATQMADAYHQDDAYASAEPVELDDLDREDDVLYATEEATSIGVGDDYLTPAPSAEVAADDVVESEVLAEASDPEGGYGDDDALIAFDPDDPEHA